MAKTAVTELQQQIEGSWREAFAAGYAAAMQRLERDRRQVRIGVDGWPVGT